MCSLNSRGPVLPRGASGSLSVLGSQKGTHRVEGCEFQDLGGTSQVRDWSRNSATHWERENRARGTQRP